MFVPRLVRSLLLTVEEIAYARACCSSCELALRPSYPDLGGNNTHHAHGCWSFHLMRHAEGGARHASGASSPTPLHDLRRIPIHFARMSQMVRDASTIVVLV